MTVISKKLSAWWPAAIWAAVIFVLSAIPGSAYPATDIVHADKLVHIGIYGVLGALCARGFLRATALEAWSTIARAALVATLYGVSDELHQLFVPGRSSDWRDAVADAISAVLGAALIVLVVRLRQGRARALD